MNKISVASRDCWVSEAPKAKAGVVILHAKDMTAYTMAGYVGWKRFSDAGITVVFPTSLVETVWDYSEGSEDFAYVDKLPTTLFALYPSLDYICLAGFSNGGFLAGVVLTNGSGQYESGWQVCATWPQDVPFAPTRNSIPIAAYLGTSDAVVPLSGTKDSVSKIVMQSLYESSGCTLAVNQFDGGHIWPGGVGAASPIDMTQILIDGVLA